MLRLGEMLSRWPDSGTDYDALFDVAQRAKVRVPPDGGIAPRD